MWDHNTGPWARGHLLLLLQDQLGHRDVVQGRAGWWVVRVLSSNGAVLNRVHMLEHERVDLGSEVLHLPFELHPPILKPGPHLIRKTNTFKLLTIFQNGSAAVIQYGDRFELYLSFSQAQLACCFHSLSGIQVFVLVEDLYQSADLLVAEFSAHSTLRARLLRLTGLAHRQQTLRGSRFTIVSRRVTACF